MYTFKCKCGCEEENLVTIGQRDSVQFFCPECGEVMKRGVDAPTLGKPAHQMHAIMSDGQKVAGHFGKLAKKK